MTTIPATDAKNKFGELLEMVHKEPVEISKKGRTVAVMLSIESYEKMSQKLLQMENPTDFSWLNTLRNKAVRLPETTPLDEADYHSHLDEKYGQ